MQFRGQILKNLEPGNLYEPASTVAFSSACEDVRLIAFYLPQFHPIAENDLWWGKGFTEWCNVTKGLPRFVGHYQPHLPADLGFYDLRLAETLRAQAELAKKYGVKGFCFHYYWFAGKKILETPLAHLLSHPEIDLPFCINWANESWVRSWDGNEKDVLIRQENSDEDDIAFMRALEPFIRDPRYIRVQGRPLIMVYRPSLLPDAIATVKRWRNFCSEAGLGDPYLVMAQASGDEDPRPYGFDAAAEFPPHKVGWVVPNLINGARRFTKSYRGRILSYDRMAQNAMAVGDEDFTLLRGVCPSWDNEARKPDKGVVFINSTPRKYGEWLDWACRKVMHSNTPDERIVFINAWNEWAEGAHLEPDRHYGHAYLCETARVLEGLSLPVSANTKSVIGVGNDNLQRDQTNLVAWAKMIVKGILQQTGMAFQGR